MTLREAGMPQAGKTDQIEMLLENATGCSKLDLRFNNGPNSVLIRLSWAEKSHFTEGDMHAAAELSFHLHRGP